MKNTHATHKQTNNTQHDQTIKDNRKQPQEHAPQTEQWRNNNKVYYNPEQKEWTCQQCQKQYGPQSMRNAILHASAHKKPE